MTSTIISLSGISVHVSFTRDRDGTWQVSECYTECTGPDRFTNAQEIDDIDALGVKRNGEWWSLRTLCEDYIDNHRSEFEMMERRSVIEARND